MGLLINGEWKDQWYDTKSTGGRFKRQEQAFRSWITTDGSAGPSGEGSFAAAPDRYHLYVGLACPWAHRTLILRALKGLEDFLPLSVVHWYMAESGWTFAEGGGVIPDAVNGADFLHQVYTAADPAFTGRVTVPILWDKDTGAIVNNESSAITIRWRTEPRLIASTSASTRRSTMVCTRPGLRQRRKRTKKTCSRCSLRSIGSKTY